MKFMVNVGSSMRSTGKPSGVDGSVMVEPMCRSSMPLTSTMSPASASSTTTRSRPLNFITWLMRPRWTSPSGPKRNATSMLPRMRPRLMRPTPILPT
ncbi:Uncharacterised protein [Bordetella pertussis]|nr:Uncharacterised protein [Bordetella pertussis]CPM47732.1 Uncharacterised protein [Bordetella pertussis]